MHFNFNNWGDGEQIIVATLAKITHLCYGLSTNNPLIWNDAINANNPGLSPNYSEILHIRN